MATPSGPASTSARTICLTDGSIQGHSSAVKRAPACRHASGKTKGTPACQGRPLPETHRRGLPSQWRPSGRQGPLRGRRLDIEAQRRREQSFKGWRGSYGPSAHANAAFDRLTSPAARDQVSSAPGRTAICGQREAVSHPHVQMAQGASDPSNDANTAKVQQVLAEGRLAARAHAGLECGCP